MSDTRKWYENNWARITPYLDRDFADKFKSKEQHESRAWEFQLAVALLDHGIKLRKKDWSHGPDFCTDHWSGERIWIEAIACEWGDVQPPPDLRIEGEAIIRDTEATREPSVGRITGAIHTKLLKINGYFADPNSGVSKNDCLVVAVNGAAIQNYSDSGSLFQRAVLGRGPEVLTFSSKGKVDGQFYTIKPSHLKRSDKGDQPLPSTFMEMDELSEIGLVIYCGRTAYNSMSNGFAVGDDFLFAYHSKADNPIPLTLFKFGTAFRKDPATGQIAQYKQTLWSAILFGALLPRFRFLSGLINLMGDVGRWGRN